MYKESSQIIEGYSIIESLHKGSKSVVYRAKRDADDAIVILKQLQVADFSQKDVNKMRREFEIGRTIDHDGVIKYLEFNTSNQRPFLITEDFGGVSLKKAFAETPLLIDSFLTIALKLAETIDCIHQSNIIHRDIKSKNIIINTQTNEIKIIDFGISSNADINEQFDSVSDLMEGTLHYISPEQTGRMNRKVDYRTDFYSLGVTFYELLTGGYPFSGNDELELIHCHIAKLPESPMQRNPLIPEMVAAIILKLMAKAAEERYQSAKGLIHDLKNCQEQWKASQEIQQFKLGELDEKSRFHIPQKLYGREVHLAELEEALSYTVRGNKALVTVSGNPGVGKSALIYDMRTSFDEYQAVFLSSKFDHLQRNIPYLGFTKAFSQLIKKLLTRSDSENAELKELLLKKVGKNIRAISELIPELDYLIGEQEALPILPPAETQNRFNLAFEQFIHCFAQEESPLVVFFDDLQWADLASLNLISRLLTETNLAHLLIIVAYRDAEIDSINSFDRVLNEIEEQQLFVKHIHVKPLDLADLKQLLKDTLYQENESILDLASLILSKTNGNPFFVNEFLKTLYQKKLIQFDAHLDAWHWNMDEIHAMSITDNVIDLMAQKLKELPNDTLEILKLAACIGTQFNSKVLSLISSKSEKSILLSLEEAIHQGMLISLSSGFSDVKWLEEDASPNMMFKFLHDRVQFAAYSLVPDNERGIIHHQIGQHLFESYSKETLEDELFTVVNHFILGIQHIQSDKKWSVLDLITQAGVKAKLSNAYESAFNLFDSITTLISKDDWKTNYEVCFKINMEYSETTYLSGRFDKAEKLFEWLLKRAQKKIHKASIYFTRIVLYMNMNRYDEVAEMGIKGANLLGVKLPKKANKLHLLPDLISLKFRMRNLDIASLIDREEMTNPELIAVMKIMENSTPGAYFTNQDLMALMVLKMIHLSLDHGFTPSTTFAFATYGLLMGSGFGDFKAGYEFGQLAYNLSNRFNETANKAKIYQLFANFINHWTQPLQSDLPFINKSLEYSKISGDYVYAGYDVFIISNTKLVLGEKIPVMLKLCDEYLEYTAKIKMQDSFNTQKILKRFYSRLQDSSLDVSDLSDDEFSDTEFEQFVSKGKNRVSEEVYFLYKTILATLFNDGERAWFHSLKSEHLLDASIGQIISAEHMFYYGLAAVMKDSVNKRILNKAIKSFKKWTSFNQENFEHKYLLLKAEKARINSKESEAITLYEAAITQSEKDGFIHIQAFANERAARYQMAIGREFLAQKYLIESIRCYLIWGATAKVEVLKNEFPLLKYAKEKRIVDSIENTLTQTSSSVETTDSIDITTVIRASQSISGEIELDSLLHKMMQLVLENAGAQFGTLVLVDKNELYLQAEGEADGSIEIGTNTDVEQAKHLAVSIVKYVQRTKQNLVLSNACKVGLFIQDEYIQTNAVRSVLCSPVLHQGKLKAIIYLENNLTTDAFTDERLRVINLLTSQLAVSLENAVLYDDMRKLNDELKSEISERKRSEEARIQAITESLRKTEELENARKFQLSLLPKSPPKLKDYEIAVFLKTATEVGGDYYDFFVNSESQFTSIIGDATGHGLSAGMMVGMTKASLNSIQLDKLNPAETLMRLNQAIKKANPGRLKMALNLAQFDDKKVQFSSAAMPPIYHYIAEKDKVEELIVPGMPLGSAMNHSFETISIELNSGDLLIGVSDGLPERKNYENEELGYEIIPEIILKNKDQSVEKLVEVLNEAGDKWSQGLANDDDITIMVIRRVT